MSRESTDSLFEVFRQSTDRQPVKFISDETKKTFREKGLTEDCDRFAQTVADVGAGTLADIGAPPTSTDILRDGALMGARLTLLQLCRAGLITSQTFASEQQSLFKELRELGSDIEEQVSTDVVQALEDSPPL